MHVDHVKPPNVGGRPHFCVDDGKKVEMLQAGLLRWGVEGLLHEMCRVPRHGRKVCCTVTLTVDADSRLSCDSNTNTGRTVSW